MLSQWVQIGFVAYALVPLRVLKGGDHLGRVDAIGSLASGPAGHRRSGAPGPAAAFKTGEPAGLVESKVATIPAAGGG